MGYAYHALVKTAATQWWARRVFLRHPRHRRHIRTSRKATRVGKGTLTLRRGRLRGTRTIGFIFCVSFIDELWSFPGTVRSRNCKLRFLCQYLNQNTGSRLAKPHPPPLSRSPASVAFPEPHFPTHTLPRNEGFAGSRLLSDVREGGRAPVRAHVSRGKPSVANYKRCAKRE